MERENRYLVFKRKDIEKYLNQDDTLRLNRIARDIQTARIHDKRDPKMECVIVEKDWPMYEDTWEAIENWVHDQVATGDLPDNDASRNNMRHG